MTLAGDTSTDAAPVDGTQAALATLWKQHEQAILDRVGVLERAVAALVRGVLDEGLRAEAEREAHKLAGTLGTFGFTKGSQCAHEVELILEIPATLGPARVPLLSELLVQLRSELSATPVDRPSVAPTRRWEKPPLILLVDDDVDLTGRLAAEAVRRGMRAQVASTPEEGRERATRERPDVVLLDLTFKNGTSTAYELLAELSDWAPPVPVLVFTVRNGFTDRMAVARGGAKGFLQKSLPPSEALDQVGYVLEQARSAGTRLLAVDDDPVILDSVRAVMEPQGLEVTTLGDPMRFWDELERVSPALILLDVDMPGASGIELCRVLRNDPRWATVPVLFLTARRDPETVQEVFVAGADDYLLKPIIPAELVTRIKNRLDRSRLHQALAETDGLTGVANRRTSREALGQLTRLAGRFNQPLCLVELDLDHLKNINDRYGHAAGDGVLQRLGELLLRSFPGDDVVSRWGGEEFVVGMYGMTRWDGVQRVAELLESFRAEEFRAGDERFHVSFSAGVSQYPEDGQDVEALYHTADEALFRAKSAGRNRVLTVEQEIDTSDQVAEVDVAVVEDDELLGELLMHTLETRGCRTRWLKDGTDAVRVLCGDDRSVRPRVLLLDVDLPGLNGVAVLRRLREEGALRRTRVIMLTSRSSEDEVLKALELGAFDHVSKPFSVPVLMHKVRCAVER
ncbi:MAG: Circadian input kinase A [uncultured Solirubrobacteraceae bacterium]|uniref:Circadian input kinase A n=1 Tax=uncultured Solirubrobacteraceae bacterium TaxID=1162706 RepID=A0A6J4RMQ1_9ACTN|nr:MAG: Circadian input kinase A [uncultured Solirubrobacteraceae bacterium]